MTWWRGHRGSDHDEDAGRIRWARAGTIGVGVATASFVLSGALLTAGARFVARAPLVPQGASRDDTAIRAAHPDRLHLDASDETLRPGVLAVRQAGGAVNVRLGDVMGRPTPTTVARPILAVDAENPRDRAVAGPARTNGYFWAGDPRTAHGLEMAEVDVASPVGAMPSWLVEADPGASAAAHGTWAILVHGLGATRGEALRAIPLLHRLGITTLTITYRNDAGAAESVDRMLHLGAAEWEDVEAAIELALARGARRIVLVGWSMGGGIVLRASILSAHREAIAALVLDSPAIDWRDILDHNARVLRTPRPMRALALWMMGSPIGSRSVRLHEPIALEQMHADHYAEHLQHPTLLLHALKDVTVPPAPSAVLAHLRPDLVRFEPFADASHTREWNTDPERYERILATFLDDELGLGVDVEGMDLPVRSPGAPPQPRSTGRRM